MSVFLDLSSIDGNQSSSAKVGNELKDLNESQVDNDSDEEPDVENLVTFGNANPLRFECAQHSKFGFFTHPST